MVRVVGRGAIAFPGRPCTLVGAECRIRAVDAVWEPVDEGPRWPFLVCLRLVSLFATRMFGEIPLATREQSWNPAATLQLRHRLTVLMRHATPARPRMT